MSRARSITFYVLRCSSCTRCALGSDTSLVCNKWHQYFAVVLRTRALTSAAPDGRLRWKWSLVAASVVPVHVVTCSCTCKEFISCCHPCFYDLCTVIGNVRDEAGAQLEILFMWTEAMDDKPRHFFFLKKRSNILVKHVQLIQLMCIFWKFFLASLRYGFAKS